MAPQTIGRYRILRELGQGATATVYLARDPVSGRQVAVKVFATAYTAAADFSARFEQTLTALARLDHPYLASPHDHGQDGDQFFVVMRYLPGGTLADRLDGRPMLLAEVVPILQRLAEALDAAHTAHLLHGDLHPADVLFDLRERAFLADLGLAQLLDPVAGPSATGTPAYMSPEQIAGQSIDGRADVYALGIVLFEMLTGRQPFAGATPQDLLHQHLEQPVPQLSGAALSHLVLPLEFNLVIARALAKNRDYRYPTAGVLAEAVRTMFLVAPADSALEAEPAQPPRPPEPPAQSQPVSQAPIPPPVISEPAPNLGPVTTEAVISAEANAEASASAAAGAAAGVPAAADSPSKVAAPGDETIASTVPAVPSSPPPAPPPSSGEETATAPEPQPSPALPSAIGSVMAANVPATPMPAAVQASGVTGADIPPELVRPAEPRPRRGPAPGTLLLGLAGIGLVLVFVLLLRIPRIRAILVAPTATATATSTATPVPSSTPSNTPSPTPSSTASSTRTATASPTLTASPSATRRPSPTSTTTLTVTPTRRPTLPPVTAAPANATQAGVPATNTSGAPTQSHLGPPPTRGP